MSDFESELTDFWSQSIQRRLRGYRGMAAISLLVNDICYDFGVEFVFYDCGPNIGPLNRAVLLDCDYFIVAAACDQFSVRALKTLGRTLATWIEDWQAISDLAPEQTYILPGRPKFLGYIPQRFRVYGGSVTGRDSRYLAEIQRRAQSEIAAVLRQVDSTLAPIRSAELKLGEVRDLHGMVGESQRQSQPISQVSGFSNKRRQEARFIFESIAKSIISKIRRSR